jgi:hypothetical protein
MRKSCEVTGTVIPGARNETIKTLAEKEINNLGKEDVVVVWNGICIGMKHTLALNILENLSMLIQRLMFL